jgi:hypothetical protein
MEPICPHIMDWSVLTGLIGTTLREMGRALESLFDVSRYAQQPLCSRGRLSGTGHPEA